MNVTPRALRRALTLGCAAAVVAGAAAAAQAAPATDPAPPTQDVAYHGYHLAVPAGWRVVDLAADPGACVRFDQHAVYLGRPSPEEHCPAHAVGRTEAVLVQPLDGAALAGPDPVQVLGPNQAAPGRLAPDTGHQYRIAVPAAGVLVTAAYGDSLDTLNAVLATATLDGSATAVAMPAAARASAVTPAIAAEDTNFTGDGFDTCDTPSSTVMAAWTSATAYRAIGVYFAGSHRACSAQPNLTASWLTTQAGRGWHFLPIYVGTQASGLGSTAATKGRNEADDAVNVAAALGIPAGSVLYNDMEGYSTTYTTNVLNYLNAWTAELHVKGYKSGVYSSLASGIHDLNANYGASSPDVIWFASYNHVKDTNTSSISSGHWVNHQRVHQYSGDVNESHGGYTLNIDGDYLDVQVAGTGSQPPPPPTWPTVSQGATGERVKTIQYLLNQQQNAGLSVDGDFGSGTLAAVKTFQTAHGLPADGVVGADTWAALVVTVQQGSTGSAVKALQSQLTAHGITTAVDGDFGPNTNTNLKTYQTGVGLAATGVADATTWKYLVA
jgi:hypothetical protein